MKISERDRRLLTLAPAVVAAIVYVWFWYLPGGDVAAETERKIAALGGVPEAWGARQAQAQAEADERAAARRAAERDYDAGLAALRRESGDGAGARRSKPGALATLNRAAAASGATIVSALSQVRGGEGAGAAWLVTFRAVYADMSECLKALAAEPGVLVRSIERIPAEDAAAKPIWNLTVEM